MDEIFTGQLSLASLRVAKLSTGMSPLPGGR